MTWPIAFCFAIAVGGLLGWYVAWDAHQRAVARQKHAALRVDLEAGVVKDFEARVRELEEASKRHQGRLANLTANQSAR